MNALPFCRFGPVNLRADPGWLLIATLLAWSLMTQVPEFGTQGTAMRIAIALGGLAGLLASLIVHELAHALVAMRYRLDTGTSTLFLFGGVSDLQLAPASARSDIRIALAGPIASALVAGLLLVLQFLPLAEIPRALLRYLTFANLALAIVNLIPAYPMDGGRVLRAALWRMTGDAMLATRIAAGAGAVLGLLILGFGLALLFRSAALPGIWFVLVGFFVFSAARSAIVALRMRSALVGLSVSDLMTKDPLCVSPDMSLDALVHAVMLPGNVSFVPVEQDGRLLGYVDKGLLRAMEIDTWENTYVGDVYMPADAGNTLSPESGAQQALDRIVATGQRKFMVARGEELLGVLSLTDLRLYLSLRDALVH